ncbi:MAG: RnfABCDGE type electron transport complex subunit D [Salinispira sp.]
MSHEAVLKNSNFSPHYSSALSIRRSMWTMNGLLTILLIWGTLIYGPRALGIVALSVLSAFIAEFLVLTLRSAPTLRPAPTSTPNKTALSDGSAVLCGLMFGLTLPPTVHWLAAVIGPVFAIIVVKWGLGGLGINLLNPALAGRLFVQLSWPEMFWVHNWGKSLLPEAGWNVDAVSGPSVLTQMKTFLIENRSGYIFRPLEIVDKDSSIVDTFLTNVLNEGILIPNGIILSEGYIDYFFGFRYGAIGEVSIVLILFISILLFARGIISWHIPLGGFIGMSTLSFIFSGTFWGANFFSGDILFALFSGGFMFTLMFMATDPVTSPYTRNGKFIFGLGFGALAFALRDISIEADASTTALLIMNMLCPLINIIARKKPLKMH